jgi:hypothetical protein
VAIWYNGKARRGVVVGGVWAFLGLLGGCQAWSAFEPEQVPETTPFVPIASNGRSVLLGDPSSWGMADEKPAGTTRFRHEYVLDRTEVTRGEFRERMGWVSEARGEGLPAQVDDSLPAQALTWFDAVLFCNARSRAQGLDTVYSCRQSPARRRRSRCPQRRLRPTWNGHLRGDVLPLVARSTRRDDLESGFRTRRGLDKILILCQGIASISRTG